MKINKSFKYRIYPTKQQEVLLNKHFGCCRFIYNWGLAKRIKAYTESKESISLFNLQKEIPVLKTSKETEWLSEVNAASLQASLKNLDVAYTGFFKQKKGFPKFKSKHNNHQSYSIPQYNEIRDGKLYIPKFREGIKLVYHRPHEGIIKSATITRTPTMKYFVSLSCEIEIYSPSQKEIQEITTVGIDMGIKDFMVTSNGIKIPNNKFLAKKLKQLKKAQRKLSRKQKGSNNRNKQRIKVAIIHEKISNLRNDFLHKTSFNLINDNQINTVIREDLNISGMVKNHCLARSISDLGWGTFFSYLDYKAFFVGKNILKIGRFKPSSKICSVCGIINKELTLKDREWVCPQCNTKHDRDINAANNIKNIGLNERNVPKELRELTLVESKALAPQRNKKSIPNS